MYKLKSAPVYYLLATFISISLSLSLSVSVFAQDDLMAELESSAPKQRDYAFATFKSTRLIDGSSIECLGAGVLDFRISHRFGEFNQGLENFFGLDNAYTKLSLDYGINRWLMIGIGHSAFNKEDDGTLKIKLLRQRTTGGMPITLTYFGTMAVETMPAPSLADSSYKWLNSNRLFFTNQLLIGRKFNDRFSLQLMPTIVHYNLVDSTKFSNNTFAMGIGGRAKLTKRSAITVEYFYRLNNTDLLVNGQKTYNSLSIGYEVETGGHVFQLMVTNSQGITERTFIGQTTESWAKGQYQIGFNVSRVFTIMQPKGYKEGKAEGKEANEWKEEPKGKEEKAEKNETKSNKETAKEKEPEVKKEPKEPKEKKEKKHKKEKKEEEPETNKKGSTVW